jgi:hypothetical protein
MPRRRAAAAAEPEEEPEEEEEEEEEAFDEEAARRAAGRMKVAELRAALEALGETPDGGKPALVEQLVAAQRAAAEEDGEQGEDEDDEDDGLDAWEDHQLLVAILRELRASRRVLEDNGDCGKHELGALDPAKRSTCGVCPAAGRKIHPPRAGRFGCKTCQVRICGWRCLNEHVNGGVGKRAGKELVFKVEAEGGQRVPGRSRASEPGPRKTVRVGGRR